MVWVMGSLECAAAKADAVIHFGWGADTNKGQVKNRTRWQYFSHFNTQEQLIFCL